MIRCDNSSRAFSMLAACALLTGGAPGCAHAQRKATKLAEGVYEIDHSSESGNTTVIIGDRQVFVVDAGFLPSDAREDIAQIRQWTDKPVSFVLNTHFHNDHNFGNRMYMNAFPAVTIIAHAETKTEMDRFGPGSLRREQRSLMDYQRMLVTGKTSDGTPLTDGDKQEVKRALAQQAQVVEQFKNVQFQSATLTFDHDFGVDIGDRQVEVKFLGRGNTGGDAVVYLPKEKIVIAGDLVVYPIPYFYDGYPTEWVQTEQALAALDATTIVPGHGPVLHDKTQLYLIRDLLKSAVDQMNEQLRKTAPAMFQTLTQVTRGVDLTPFRKRFAGNDPRLGTVFDREAANLIKLTYEEATLR